VTLTCASTKQLHVVNFDLVHTCASVKTKVSA